MSEDSRRVAETKERIRDAFFDLYSTKKIERISIKEITDKAQLNRGTFYVYYKDIYDLLEKTEDELIEEVVEKVQCIIPMLLRDERLNLFLPILSFLEGHSKFLRILLGENGDPNFIHKVKTIIKKTMGDLIQKEKIPPVENIEYVMEYLASAHLGVISFWLQNEMSLPVNELGRLVQQAALHGPMRLLLGQEEDHAETTPNGPN